MPTAPKMSLSNELFIIGKGLTIAHTSKPYTLISNKWASPYRDISGKVAQFETPAKALAFAKRKKLKAVLPSQACSDCGGRGVFAPEDDGLGVMPCSVCEGTGVK